MIAFDNSSGNVAWFRPSVDNTAYVTAWLPAAWYYNTQNQLGASIPPYTWAANDRINGSFSYEIA